MASVWRTEALSLEIVFEVIERYFFSAPAFLVLQEAVVGGICSSKTQTAIALTAIPADRFPHDKIRRSCVLKGHIRCTEFIESLFVEMEIDITGNHFSFMGSQHHMAQLFLNNMFIYVLEEGDRLGRCAVFLSGHAM